MIRFGRRSQDARMESDAGSLGGVLDRFGIAGVIETHHEPYECLGHAIVPAAGYDDVVIQLVVNQQVLSEPAMGIVGTHRLNVFVADRLSDVIAYSLPMAWTRRSASSTSGRILFW